MRNLAKAVAKMNVGSTGKPKARRNGHERSIGL